MRVTITAQAPTRGELTRLLLRLVANISAPSALGAKARSENDTTGYWGFAWEIVPDEHEHA